MSPERGIDIAWDRPTISQIKGVGATWVARYFSPDSTKNLTAAEVRDYAAAGIGTVTVWESSATRALDGYAAGQADAHAAEQQRAAVGLPPTQVIHFAVDTDTTWAAVEPYFAGAASVIGQARTGAYGGLKVIRGAAAAGYRYLWQTDAWSGGVWDPHATIRQEGGTCLAGQADYDDAEAADFGQHPRPTTPEVPDMTPDQVKMLTELHAAMVPHKGWDYSGPLAGGGHDAPDVHQQLGNTLAQARANGGTLTELKQGLAGLAGLTLTGAQVQGLAAQVAPVLEKLLVPALLEAVGHALDGTKPAPAAAVPVAPAAVQSVPAPVASAPVPPAKS